MSKDLLVLAMMPDFESWSVIQEREVTVFPGLRVKIRDRAGGATGLLRRDDDFSREEKDKLLRRSHPRHEVGT